MNHPTFDFAIEKVREYYNKNLPKVQWLEYLRYVLEEYKKTDEFDLDKSGFGQKVYTDLLIIGEEIGDKSGTHLSGEERLKWNGTITQLVILINELIDTDLIDAVSLQNQKWSVIKELFTDRYGKDIDLSILQETEAYLNSNETAKEKIQISKIISEVKNKI